MQLDENSDKFIQHPAFSDLTATGFEPVNEIKNIFPDRNCTTGRTKIIKLKSIRM